MSDRLAQLEKERQQICQHLVGRDDCEDLVDVVAKVLAERMRAMEAMAEVEDERLRIEQLEDDYQDGMYQYRLAEGLLSALNIYRGPTNATP